MKVGDIVNLDINYNPTVKPKLELAVIRGINTDYSPTRYYLTVIPWRQNNDRFTNTNRDSRGL